MSENNGAGGVCKHDECYPNLCFKGKGFYGKPIWKVSCIFCSETKCGDRNGLARAMEESAVTMRDGVPIINFSDGDKGILEEALGNKRFLMVCRKNVNILRFERDDGVVYKNHSLQEFYKMGIEWFKTDTNYVEDYIRKKAEWKLLDLYRAYRMKREDNLISQIKQHILNMFQSSDETGIVNKMLFHTMLKLPL